MTEQKLRQELDRVALRYRRLLLRTGMACCWLLLAGIGAAALTWARGMGYAVPGLVLVLIVALPILLVPLLLSAVRAVRDPLWIARRIEQRFPDLDARLLAALEQHQERPDKPLGYLQQTVVDEALDHANRHPWEHLVPLRKLRLAQAAQWAMLLLFALTLVTLISDISRRPAQDNWWLGGVAAADGAFEIKVEPEDTSVERNTSLLVLARFPRNLPADVQLLYRDPDGQVKQMQMSKSLDDPVFAGRVSSVTRDLAYAVRYADKQTRWFKATVFDYPELRQADARLQFPQYTGMEEKLVEDVRTVTAVEGTRATLTLRLNKPVKEARLLPGRRAAQPTTVAEQKPPELKADPADPTVYTASVDMTQSQSFRLRLVDEDNRGNKEPPELVLNVTPNRPPDLKLAWPGRDLDVSPLEEMALRAQVWDDFGVRRVGVSYGLAGQDPQDVVLVENVAAKEKREVGHVVALEKLEAEPDQLLSYHLWVEDVGPDGAVRRTQGDMFFAEVRPFEEIFRQGQQPAGGEQEQQQQQQGGQNAQEAQELAELQKQIISATWKVMTREVRAQPSAQFVPDVKLIAESQASAKELAEGLGERLQDERSRQFLKNVLRHMEEAINQLNTAFGGPVKDPLQPALVAEQSAYQELLKLRAREHEVVRSNRQQQQASQSSSNSRRQRQMNQLELDNEENRYEQQRNANPQQENQQQRETRQVLNRLRELAQRQEDLNRQMKELQAALQEARDQAQREEINRQLARLRDQQQQVLRDTDELRDRMDQPENQQRMSEAREQLEQTRENVRRASEALEQGMVPEAAAAGTRAGEELNNLRDDFRRQAANQFTDAMNEMRRDARELDQKQQQLSQQLSEMDPSRQGRQGEQGQRGEQPQPQRTLRDGGQRQEVAEGLKQQKEQLDRLLENMRRTIEEAEASEPLLSKELYDTVRDTRQRPPEKALEGARELVERGFMEEARQAEGEAGKGITRLREGVEKAAESVLGDETEALRRARNEIDSLAQELEREARRNGAAGFPTTRPSDDAVAQGNDPRQGNGQQPDQSPNQQPGETPGERQASADGQQGGRQQRDGQQSGRQQGQRSQQGQQGQTPGEGAQSQQPGQEGQEGQEGQQGQQGQQGQEGQRGQGGRQGSQPGQQRGNGRQANAGQRAGQQGDQAGQQPGEEGSQQQQSDNQSAEGAEGNQDGQQRGGPQQDNRQQGGNNRGGGGGLRQRDADGNDRPGDLRRLLEGGGGGGNTGPEQDANRGPFTGEGFRDWADRLRDVEEMVGDPRLRAEAARIRERARSIRADSTRHSQPPNWDLVRDFVMNPLVELRQSVSEELLRRQSNEAMVPLDREPVPPEYAEQVRRYYERLGSGR